MATADEKHLENLFSEGNNKLTAKMFSEVSNGNKGESFILSAYSVLTPLAQLALASADEAQDELLETIGMPDTSTTKEVFSLADKKLRSVKGITLKTASKIYVANRYELNEQFAADTRETFTSKIQSINFIKKQEAANVINTWVEEQTNNRIKDLVNPDILSEDTRALLVNAIYFKGSWMIPFNKHRTQERNFHVNKNKINKVPMMFINGHFKYRDSKELKSQIIEIPYLERESSFVVVLPKNITGIDKVKQKMKNPTILENKLKNMVEKQVDLYLPKFKIDTTTDLKKILTQMNVTRMFGERTANLKNLIKGLDRDLCVDSATQKAFIEVNEEGSEAAAANVLSACATSIRARPIPISFIADHPFVFLLRGRDHTLFSGIYYSNG